MSERSEQQYDEIIKKLNELLEQNKVLAQQNAQKDDEIALLKEQNNYLMRKLFGSKKETIMDLNLNPKTYNTLFLSVQFSG